MNKSKYINKTNKPMMNEWIDNLNVNQQINK